jgi:hypothetical protein
LALLENCFLLVYLPWTNEHHLCIWRCIPQLSTLILLQRRPSNSAASDAIDLAGLDIGTLVEICFAILASCLLEGHLRGIRWFILRSGEWWCLALWGIFFSDYWILALPYWQFGCCSFELLQVILTTWCHTNLKDFALLSLLTLILVAWLQLDVFVMLDYIFKHINQCWIIPIIIPVIIHDLSIIIYLT